MRTLYVLLRVLPFLLSFRRDSRRWLVIGGPVRRSAAFHQRRAEALVRTIAALGPRIASGDVKTDALVSTVMELYVQMMLVDGLFHADPHPGNLLVRDDGG